MYGQKGTTRNEFGDAVLKLRVHMFRTTYIQGGSEKYGNSVEEYM